MLGRRICSFATATPLNCQPEKVQAATFLVFIDKEGRRIFNTFLFESEEDKMKLNVLKEKIENHFKPAVNLAYQEFIFAKRDQEENKRFDDWLTALQFLVQGCEFGSLTDCMLCRYARQETSARTNSK